MSYIFVRDALFALAQSILDTVMQRLRLSAMAYTRILLDRGDKFQVLPIGMSFHTQPPLLRGNKVSGHTSEDVLPDSSFVTYYFQRTIFKEIQNLPVFCAHQQVFHRGPKWAL